MLKLSKINQTNREDNLFFINHDIDEDDFSYSVLISQTDIE